MFRKGIELMREQNPRLGGADTAAGPTNEVLVAGTLRGEADAFEGIMRRYNQRLFRLARSMVNDDAEAEDIVQEAYVRGYAKLAELSRPEGLGAWLSRIVVNEAISRYRRQSRLEAPRTAPGDTEADTWHRLLQNVRTGVPDPEELAAMQEIRHLVERAIDELPEAYRTVFMMRAVEQLSTAETAECLDISPQTVKTRFHRGRQLLQSALSERINSAATGAFPFAGERCDRTVAGVLERVGLRLPRQDARH
jgi:RNA polymerase sigma-70 factor (ECF subfamily)